MLSLRRRWEQGKATAQTMGGKYMRNFVLRNDELTDLWEVLEGWMIRKLEQPAYLVTEREAQEFFENSGEWGLALC